MSGNRNWVLVIKLRVDVRRVGVALFLIQYNKYKCNKTKQNKYNKVAGRSEVLKSSFFVSFTVFFLGTAGIARNFTILDNKWW